jgi:hypothetical protein
MRTKTELTDAGREYAAVYAAQYTGHDLPLAVQLSKRLLASHPNAPQADYLRIQVQNIVNDIVPKQELRKAQMELVLDHFEHDRPFNAKPIPVTTSRCGSVM